MSDRTHPKLGQFRRIFAQILATSVNNCLLFSVGLCCAISTIIIPALTGIPNQLNGNESLIITPDQVSWIVSIAFLCQPVGSLCSSMVIDLLSRKRSMIVANVPFAIGWFTLYRATEVWEILFGLAIHGFAIAFIESTVIIFLGEICEPSIRSVLMGYSLIFPTLGIFVVYLLNTLMAWRSVALSCLFIPLFTAVALCFIPESPQWLLSKNRQKDAEKSLCWLRGWISSDLVSQELQILKQHSERSKSCSPCVKQDLKCSHEPPTLCEKLLQLKRKQTLKPFSIIILLSFLTHFTGEIVQRPFLVQIFRAYKSPVAPDQAAIITSAVLNVANVVLMCSIRFIGKRRMYLITASGIFLSSFIIACYGFVYLPSGFNSFDRSNQSFHLENPNLAYIPMICLFVWSFCSFCGFLSMPFMLLGELFPFKTRSVANGIASAFSCALGFISKKSYYNLETTLSLPGVSLFYSLICGLGLVLVYFILPETENRTLEDIELHFADNAKKITDRKICKSHILVKHAKKNAENSNDTDEKRQIGEEESLIK